MELFSIKSNGEVKWIKENPYSNIAVAILKE